MNDSSLMTVSNWLNSSTKKLEDVGIASARLDCLILLEDCLKLDRSQILAHPETVLKDDQLQQLDKQLASRAKHQPLAYVRGVTEFYGRTFAVGPEVLEPRVESEVMISLMLKLELPKNPKILDVGAGSGAIGITAALEMPGATVDLVDLDPATLPVATKNAKDMGVTTKVYQGDLLEGLSGPYDVLLCNLPYVPDSWQINEAAMMEPRIAIFGGPDGLALYRKLFDQISKLSWKPKYIITECLPPQHDKLQAIAREHGYHAPIVDDFIQVFSLRV